MDSDMRSLLPLLEHPRADSGLDGATARQLVAYGATAWSDWWASKALDWVDNGVWGEDVAEALRCAAGDKRYSQSTRHRAWRHVKHRERVPSSPTLADPRSGGASRSS